MSNLLSWRLFDADGGGFEFRGARLRVGGVNGQFVGGNLIVEMNVHEGEAGTQPGIESHGSDNGATTGGDTNLFPFVETVARAVLRAQIESLGAAKRRTVVSGLHAGIVGVEPAS